MEPLLLILVPGVIGGVVLSLLIARNRRGTPPTFVPRRLELPSPSLINMSSIKVEGLGGLGMVAAVIAVAIADPRIRTAVLVAMILGGVLALVLIARRRREADRSESGPGGESMLHIVEEHHRYPTDPTPPEREAKRGASLHHVHGPVAGLATPV
jgi:hypothetical protein